MLFQTRKSFVHLWNTNSNIFNEIGEILVLTLTVCTTTPLMLQKVY